MCFPQNTHTVHTTDTQHTHHTHVYTHEGDTSTHHYVTINVLCSKHTYTYIHIHLHVCIHMYTLTTMLHTHTHTCSYVVQVCVRRLSSLLLDVYTCIYIHACVYIHVHVCTPTEKYMYMYMYSVLCLTYVLHSFRVSFFREFCYPPIRLLLQPNLICKKRQKSDDCHTVQIRYEVHVHV